MRCQANIWKGQLKFSHQCKKQALPNEQLCGFHGPTTTAKQSFKQNSIAGKLDDTRGYLDEAVEIYCLVQRFLRDRNTDTFLANLRPYVFDHFMRHLGEALCAPDVPSIYNFFFNTPVKELPIDTTNLRLSRWMFMPVLKGQQDYFCYTTFLEDNFVHHDDGELCDLYQCSLQYWETAARELVLRCHCAERYFRPDRTLIDDSNFWRQFMLPARKSTLRQAGVLGNSID